MEIDFGRVKFSNEARRAEVMALYEWYGAEHEKIMDAEEDAAETARDQVFEAYGLE